MKSVGPLRQIDREPRRVARFWAGLLAGMAAIVLAPPASTVAAPAASASAAAHPDFSGVWQIEFPYSLAGREGMKPTDGKPIPEQPWTAALHAAAMVSNRPGNDPWPPNNQRCLIAGTMRAMKGNFPWRLIQTDDKILLLFEEDGRFNTWLFKDAHDPDVKPSWHGDAIARWEGDTLVIDVTGFNGKTPFPHGLLHTMQLRLTHRIRLIEDGKKLEDRITIDDPGAFTRPFEVVSIFARQPADYRLRDYRCAENNRDLPEPMPWWSANWGPD